MARHWEEREFLFHGLEHLAVILLLGVVLFQASQTVEEPVETGDPVVIVPATDAFTARPGQAVRLPWLVVNAENRDIRVRSGISFDWERDLDDEEELPGGVTALVVAPQQTSASSLAPGDHRQYEYRFRAPPSAGEYRITLVAESEGQTVTRPVRMAVSHP